MPWQVQMGGKHYGNVCPPVLFFASYFRGVSGTLLGLQTLIRVFWYYYSNVSVASITKFQFVNHVTETYAFSILSNKVRGLILSAQFIVSMAD